VTWRYEVADNGSELRVWDHTQDPATDAPLTTVQNDGSGVRIPGNVLDVMQSEYATATENGNTDRRIKCAANAAFEQIERVDTA